MSEENISQGFRLKNIDEIRNYFIEEINQNELRSKKHKKGCRVLNYIEHLLIFRCVSISAFASLVGIPIGITSYAIGLKMCVITAGIKKYKSIIKKKMNKHDKTVLRAKPKLNSVEVLIFRALIDSIISYDEFASVNNVLKEYDDMKEEIKYSNDKSYLKTVLSYCLKCRKNAEVKTQNL